jgi:hypothetical protein
MAGGLRSPFDRDIARLAIPAVGALAAEPLYILTDTAIVGRIGTPELGGLAVAATLVLTGYSVFVFLAYGTTGTVARLLGAGQAARAAAQGVQALWLAAAIGVVLAALGLAFAEPLVSLMGAAPEVRPHALTYLRISMAGVPSLMLVLAGTGYLRGLQDTRTPLVVAVVSALANLGDRARPGLRASTPASPARRGPPSSPRPGPPPSTSPSSCATCGPRASPSGPTEPPRRARHRQPRPVRPDRRAAGQPARRHRRRRPHRRGRPRAHQVAFELWSFLALVLDAIAIAGQAMVGRLLGAGDADGARAASRRMIEWGSPPVSSPVPWSPPVARPARAVHRRRRRRPAGVVPAPVGGGPPGGERRGVRARRRADRRR